MFQALYFSTSKIICIQCTVSIFCLFTKVKLNQCMSINDYNTTWFGDGISLHRTLHLTYICENTKIIIRILIATNYSLRFKYNHIIQSEYYVYK